MTRDSKADNVVNNVVLGERFEYNIDLATEDQAHSLAIPVIGMKTASVEYIGIGAAGQGALAVKEGNLISPTNHKDFSPAILLAIGELEPNINISTSYLSLHYAGGGTGKLKIIINLKAH